MSNVFLVPCTAPEKFETGVINSTSVWLKWNRLHVFCYRGILRGYILFYKRKSESVYLNVTVPPTSNKTVLDSLWKFAVYHIKIAGFTSKGLGPISQDVAVKTGEDGKQMYVYESCEKDKRECKLY